MLRTKDVKEGVRGGGLALATRHHARVAPHVLVGRRSKHERPVAQHLLSVGRKGSESLLVLMSHFLKVFCRFVVFTRDFVVRNEIYIFFLVTGKTPKSRLTRDVPERSRNDLAVLPPGDRGRREPSGGAPQPDVLARHRRHVGHGAHEGGAWGQGRREEGFNSLLCI